MPGLLPPAPLMVPLSPPPSPCTCAEIQTAVLHRRPFAQNSPWPSARATSSLQALQFQAADPAQSRSHWFSKLLPLLQAVTSTQILLFSLPTSPSGPLQSLLEEVPFSPRFSTNSSNFLSCCEVPHSEIPAKKPILLGIFQEQKGHREYSSKKGPCATLN